MPKKQSNVTPLSDAKKDAADDAELVPSEGEKEQLIDQEKVSQVRHSELVELVRVSQMGGVSKAAHAMENANKVLSLKAIQEIKESKVYKIIPYQGEDGKMYHCGTFRVYCEKVLGRSYPRVNSDLTSLAKFGQRPLEIMYEAGIGEREKVKLRNLSEEDIESLADEIAGYSEATDPAAKTAIHKAVDRMIREKIEPLQQELEEAKAQEKRLTNEVKDRDAKETLRKAEEKKRTAPQWSEPIMVIREESAAAAMVALSALDDFERLLEKLEYGADEQAEYSAGASAIGLHISSVIARLASLYQLLQQRGLDSYLDEQDLESVLLTDQEIADIQKRWGVVAGDLQKAREQREAARNEQVSRGRRGRPKGAKNKPKAAKK